MSIFKLAPGSKDRKSLDVQEVFTKRSSPEVISLDDDDDDEEVSNDIEEEDLEELVDKNNSENDPDVMEVISLPDDEEEEESSSDENEDTALGTARLAFLDSENKKIHKFIKIINAEHEEEMVDVEEISSDSEIEEIPKKNHRGNASNKSRGKRIYITIDPEDYKKVRSKENELPKLIYKSKKNRQNEPARSSKSEGSEGSNFPVNNSQNVETPDSLKGPNIPKAICCHSCSFVCFKEEGLAVHIAKKHPSKAESIRTYTAAEIQELEREMRDQADECSSCSQALWYLPTLRAHALLHSTGKSDCEACHHGTSVIKLLMEHLESHVGSEEEEDSDM